MGARGGSSIFDWKLQPCETVFPVRGFFSFPLQRREMTEGSSGWFFRFFLSMGKEGGNIPDLGEEEHLDAASHSAPPHLPGPSATKFTLLVIVKNYEKN